MKGLVSNRFTTTNMIPKENTENMDDEDWESEGNERELKGCDVSEREDDAASEENWSDSDSGVFYKRLWEADVARIRRQLGEVTHINTLLTKENTELCSLLAEQSSVNAKLRLEAAHTQKELLHLEKELAKLQPLKGSKTRRTAIPCLQEKVRPETGCLQMSPGRSWEEEKHAGPES